jgi:PRTRC genetic system ThiF family protein
MNEQAKTFRIPPHWLGDRPLRIALVGVGGTGSILAGELASLETTLRRLGHPGFDVTVFDPDRVSPANIGRQRYCEADLGLWKAVVSVHRINLFFNLEWRAVPTRFERTRRSPVDFDLLLTCVDSAAARLAIGAVARRWRGALWLDTGNGRSTGQVVLGHVGNRLEGDGAGVRLPNVLDLFPELVAVDDTEEHSCSTEEALRRQELPVNRVAATIAFDLIYQLLRHSSLTTHGAQFSLAPLRVSPIPIEPAAWAYYGHMTERGLGLSH